MEKKKKKPIPQDGKINGYSQEELDEFSQQYIWDEENKVLYEVTPKRRKIEFSFFSWACLAFCVLLLAAAATAMLLHGQPILRQNLNKEVSVLSQPAKEEAEAVPHQQEAVPDGKEEIKAASGYVPTAISIDGKLQGILASQEAAHAFIEEVKAYYAAMAAGEGELTVELTQDVQLLPMPNAAAEELTSYEDLFALFTSTDTPMDVQCTRVTTASETVDYDIEEEKDSYLLKGTRIVVSEGRDGEEITISYEVYINGKKSTSRSGTETQEIQGQDRVIRVGSAKITGEDAPGKSEGKQGKSTELTFVSPIAGRGQLQLWGAGRGAAPGAGLQAGHRGCGRPGQLCRNGSQRHGAGRLRTHGGNRPRGRVCDPLRPPGLCNRGRGANGGAGSRHRQGGEQRKRKMVFISILSCASTVKHTIPGIM